MRSRIASLALLVALIPLVAHVGCDSDDSDDQDRQQRLVDDDNIDDLVVFGRDIEITIDDVIDAVDRTRLLAPQAPEEIPSGEAEWMAQPQAQVGLVRNVVRAHIVRQAAAQRDISLSPRDELERIDDFPQLAKYRPLFEKGDPPEGESMEQQLQSSGLSVNDVRRLVQDAALEDKLKQALADEVDEEMLWPIYQAARDEIDILVVEMMSTPSSQEIESALQTYDREIRAHYRDNRQQFQIPARLHSTLLRPQGPDAHASLEEAAQRLADGDDPDAIADDLNMEHIPDFDLTARDLPDLGDGEDTIGETGVQTESPRGDFAFRIDDRTDSEIRSLDRPLRREIASRLLRDIEGITPSNQESAQKAVDILAQLDADETIDDNTIKETIQALSDEGFDAHRTQPFSLQGNQVVPGVGLVEQFFEHLKELSFDDPVTDPVLDRNKIYIARLLDRSRADRDEFDDNYEEFRVQFLEANRSRLLDEYIRREQLERDINFHFAALGNVFGHMDKAPDEPVSIDELPDPEE